MKIRSGFVSNSSSSSFIICFNEKPTTKEEFIEKCIDKPSIIADFDNWSGYSDEEVKAFVNVCIDRLWNDIENARKIDSNYLGNENWDGSRNNLDSIVRDIIESNHFFIIMDWIDNHKEELAHLEYDERWSIENFIKSGAVTQEDVDQLRETINSNYSVKVHYSDNGDCQGSELEHNIVPGLDNVTVLTISHH